MRLDVVFHSVLRFDQQGALAKNSYDATTQPK